MPTSTVHIESFSEPLAAVRHVLNGADDAILSVAFVQRRGVSLLERQLHSIGTGRLVTTTVFGSTMTEGLDAIQNIGFGVRVLNPSGGTFHPKLYLARHGEEIAAAVGSANLTSGLVANVELVTVLRGRHDAPELCHLVELSESWWAHHDAIDWSSDRVPAAQEILDPGLLRQIEVAVASEPEVRTLGDRPRPNWIREVTPDGVWVETQRSRAAGRPPQLVEAVDDPVRVGLPPGPRCPHQPVPAQHRRPQRQALELRLRTAGTTARGVRRVDAADQAGASTRRGAHWPTNGVAGNGCAGDPRPDDENTFVVDGEVETIDIDLERAFNGREGSPSLVRRGAARVDREHHRESRTLACRRQRRKTVEELVEEIAS